MVTLEIPSPDVPPSVKPAKCKLNPGVFDSFGNHIHYPSRIWVDDPLLTTVGIFFLRKWFWQPLLKGYLL